MVEPASMSDTEGPQRTVICGAGPVGALAALYAAKRGDDVHVYEMRDGEYSTTRVFHVNVRLKMRNVPFFQDFRKKFVIVSISVTFSAYRLA